MDEEKKSEGMAPQRLLIAILLFALLGLAAVFAYQEDSHNAAISSMNTQLAFKDSQLEDAHEKLVAKTEGSIKNQEMDDQEEGEVLEPVNDYPLSSQTYAVMSDKMYSAFICAGYAAFMDNDEENERLTLFAIDQGKQFFGALQAGKITDEDAKNYVPIVVLWNLGGISDDYRLGRLAAIALDGVSDEVLGTDPLTVKTKFARDSDAQIGFNDGNCNILGL